MKPAVPLQGDCLKSIQRRETESTHLSDKKNKQACSVSGAVKEHTPAPQHDGKTRTALQIRHPTKIMRSLILASITPWWWDRWRRCRPRLYLPEGRSSSPCPPRAPPAGPRSKPRDSVPHCAPHVTSHTHTHTLTHAVRQSRRWLVHLLFERKNHCWKRFERVL